MAGLAVSTVADWLSGARGVVPHLDAELIALASFAPVGADRSWLVSHNVVKITTEQQTRANEMLRRRAAGEPLAYILGYKEFYGRRFRVGPAVLIPRPETESLIDLAKMALDGRFGPLAGSRRPDQAKALSEQGSAVGTFLGPAGGPDVQILEIGTGSGCIAVTLALERPDCAVTATDIDVDALVMARQNAADLGAKVRFLQADLLQETPEKGLLGQKYALLVANLPYVDENWAWLERRTLDFEPKSALYAAENGLALYKRLLEQVNARRLTETVILEADPCQQAELVAFAESLGWKLAKKQGFGLLLERFGPLLER